MIDLEQAKKICACIPFADANAGLTETAACMRGLIGEVEALRNENLALARRVEAAEQALNRTDAFSLGGGYSVEKVRSGRFVPYFQGKCLSCYRWEAAPEPRPPLPDAQEFATAIEAVMDVAAFRATAPAAGEGVGRGE